MNNAEFIPGQCWNAPLIEQWHWRWLLSGEAVIVQKRADDARFFSTPFTLWPRLNDETLKDAASRDSAPLVYWRVKELKPNVKL